MRSWSGLLLALLILVGLAPLRGGGSGDDFLVAPGVAYAPRGASFNSPYWIPLEWSIRQDLRQLRADGFRSIVTYGSNQALGRVPEIAREEGFDGTVVMGLWDPYSREEWENALHQAPFVDGYCLGNEGLGVRYTAGELSARMADLRRLTGKPVTTSEPIDSYLDGPYREWLESNSDWIFPIAHPVLAERHDVRTALRWLTARHDLLVAMTQKPVVVKELGFPSQGAAACTEAAQVAFFEGINSTGIAFFFFEAFDQPWKSSARRNSSIEPHWGLYRADGSPKRIVAWLKSSEPQ